MVDYLLFVGLFGLGKMILVVIVVVEMGVVFYVILGLYCFDLVYW